MKLLYLSTWDFTNEASDGVCKKIRSQISVFEKNEFDVDFIYIKDGKIIYRESGQERNIGSIGAVKKTPAYMKMYRRLKEKNYDWVYNRYGMMDTFYYRVLKRLHRNGARILIEIPTYPYVKEIPDGLLYKVMIKWDKMYVNKLKNYVDRIATYTFDDEIFGIKTIKIKNGIDFSQIKLKEEKQPTGSIDLIGVAHLSKWHAFDRFIEGMHQYYANPENQLIINFHVVGDGEELSVYKQLVHDFSLDEHVIFYGNQSGMALDEIYDKCDIAVSSLGLHRIGITEQASVLKSREYSAKGMPMISSIIIDIFKPGEYKYIHYFPQDDTPIDMLQIIQFYEMVVKEGDIRSVIRDYAYGRCDQTVVSLPIVNYMKEAHVE